MVSITHLYIQAILGGLSGLHTYTHMYKCDNNKEEVMDLIGSRGNWRGEGKIEIIRTIYSRKKILKNFKLKNIAFTAVPFTQNM